MSSPQVSIIIPNYNGSKYLHESINSALSQAEVQVEVIVVDDGSTDESRSILESYGEKIRTFYQENKGAPAARNVGWRKANADFIKFLDADDVLLPGVLKIQCNQIKELSGNQIPYGDAIWTDEDLKPLKGYPVNPIKPGQDPVHHILTQNPLTSAPLHRKNLLDKVGGFDEELIKGQEFDLHFRLVLIGCQFRFYVLKIYLFRQHDDLLRFSNISLSINHEKLFMMLEKQWRMIEKFYKQRVPDMISTEFAMRFWNYGRGILRHSRDKHKVEKFFRIASSINGGRIPGSFIYRSLVELLGPYKTEKIISKL